MFQISFSFFTVVTLRFQKFKILILVSGVLRSWQNTDLLLFSHKLNIVEFFWLSSKCRLKHASHQAKVFSVQSISSSLDRGKIFMFFSPNVQLLLGLKGMNLFQLFYRHPLPVFAIMQISVKIGNAAVSKTFLSLWKLKKFMYASENWGSHKSWIHFSQVRRIPGKYSLISPFFPRLLMGYQTKTLAYPSDSP